MPPSQQFECLCLVVRGSSLRSDIFTRRKASSPTPHKAMDLSDFKDPSDFEGLFGSFKGGRGGGGGGLRWQI